MKLSDVLRTQGRFDATAIAKAEELERMEAVQADTEHYLSEVLRARDRAVALREAHEEEAAAGHPNYTGKPPCPICTTILSVVGAMDSDKVIDHEALHTRLDRAEGLLRAL